MGGSRKGRKPNSDATPQELREAGQILKETRERKRLGQAALGRQLSDTREETVRRWEQGKNAPTRGVLMELLAVLGCDDEVRNQLFALYHYRSGSEPAAADDMTPPGRDGGAASASDAERGGGETENVGNESSDPIELAPPVERTRVLGPWQKALLAIGVLLLLIGVGWVMAAILDDEGTVSVPPPPTLVQAPTTSAPSSTTTSAVPRTTLSAMQAQIAAWVARVEPACAATAPERERLTGILTDIPLRPLTTPQEIDETMADLRSIVERIRSDPTLRPFPENPDAAAVIAAALEPFDAAGDQLEEAATLLESGDLEGMRAKVQASYPNLALASAAVRDLGAPSC